MGMRTDLSRYSLRKAKYFHWISIGDRKLHRGGNFLRCQSFLQRSLVRAVTVPGGTGVKYRTEVG